MQRRVVPPGLERPVLPDGIPRARPVEDNRPIGGTGPSTSWENIQAGDHRRGRLLFRESEHWEGGTSRSKWLAYDGVFAGTFARANELFSSGIVYPVLAFDPNSGGLRVSSDTVNRE